MLDIDQTGQGQVESNIRCHSSTQDRFMVGALQLSLTHSSESRIVLSKVPLCV